MITIDDKTYTEDDLNEAQIVQVQRIESLRGQLNQLDMQAQELNVLINAYANSIKESLEES
jgi:peptidoglycan hydrolase CwlO-like protein